MNDMYEYLSPWYIPFANVPLGIWPMSKFEEGVETFAECNGIKLRGVHDDSKYNRKNVSRYIKNGLINNKPVAMLIGANSELDNTEVVQCLEYLLGVDCLFRFGFIYRWRIYLCMFNVF